PQLVSPIHPPPPIPTLFPYTTLFRSDAIRLEQAIRFFLNLPPEEDGATVSDDGLELLSLPDWETLPYDLFSPHQDITSRRIRTLDRKSTRLNSSHVKISYAVFCLKKK